MRGKKKVHVSPTRLSPQPQRKINNWPDGPIKQNPTKSLYHCSFLKNIPFPAIQSTYGKHLLTWPKDVPETKINFD